MSYAKGIDPLAVRNLLDQTYLEVDHVDKSGSTALTEAAWNKAPLSVILMLIEAGANVNHVTDRGDTLIGTYLYWNDTDDKDTKKGVKAILEAGFDTKLLSANDYAKIKDTILEFEAANPNGKKQSVTAKPASAQPIDITAEKPVVDSSQEVTVVKMRLHDGQQVSLDLNTDHLVMDLYVYVNSVAPLQQGFKLFAGYPPRSLEDMMLTIKEAQLCNTVITQKPVV